MDVIRSVWHEFDDAGIEVLSPKDSPLINGPDAQFVRFGTDDPQNNDAQIERIAMHRILRADFVYVVTPKGYVGQTTCWELGRIQDHEQPHYFSERPRGLPIDVPDPHIATPAELIERFQRETPRSIIDSLSDTALMLERGLVRGDYFHI
jgi:hypothetical protein